MKIELRNVVTGEQIVIEPDENGRLYVPAGKWEPARPLGYLRGFAAVRF